MGPVGPGTTDRPPTLQGERFHIWMDGRRVFVSSPMDPEMAPARDAVSGYLRQLGATPVMWEGITPLDRRAEDAFLDGVAESSVFVLMLGSRYGQTDATGYSPTHKEANRARDLELPRLLFERTVPTAERDGRLNDWIGSLHAEISGARYTTPADLVQQLDQRLREIAGAQDTYWVKLGPLVFPAIVRQKSQQGSATFQIRATLRDPAVRRGVASLGQGVGGLGGHRDLQLTWGVTTRIVRVDSVDQQSSAVSADEVEILCSLAQQQHQSPYAVFGGVTFSEQGRNVGPAEQAAMWADRALFSTPALAASQRDRLVNSVVAPDGPTLPQVLETAAARGWLAEGLTRLYAVEGLATKFGGHFETLAVGPATAAAVRIRGHYRLPGSSAAMVQISGSVPLQMRSAGDRSSLRGVQ